MRYWRCRRLRWQLAAWSLRGAGKLIVLLIAVGLGIWVYAWPFLAFHATAAKWAVGVPWAVLAAGLTVLAWFRLRK